MAGNLTGDFDIIAEFAVPAVGRLMAAMHRCERFPHSMSLRVDDTPRPDAGHHPVIVETVDTFGMAVAEAGRVGRPRPFPGALASTSAVHAGLGVLVNGDQLTVGLQPTQIEPSQLAGVAQVQVGPPTIEVPDASGAKLTARLPLRARYRPDPHTAPAAEFVHGELRVTTAINQVVSQPAGLNVVEIAIKSNDVEVALVPSFASSPLSPADLAGIQLLLRNALRTSFLPSNATLPDRVKHLQVKTLPGGGGAVAILLNLGATRGAPASVTDMFVGAGNDFGLGVSRDFLLAAFDPLLRDLRTRPVPPQKVSLPLLGTGTYTITINDATADLQTGTIVLTIRGRARGSRFFTPNFDFTTRLAFGLAPNGDAVDLVPGDVSVDTTSTFVDTFAKGAVVSGVRAVRDDALAHRDASGRNAFSIVSELLSADRNLGQFLRSLLNSARPTPGLPPLPEVFLLLFYNSVEIEPGGLALRGSLAVGPSPPAHVEFQPIEPTRPPGLPDIVPTPGPDFSALKSWIPGGIIDRFEWSTPGQQPFIDEHRFVLLAQGPVLDPATAAGIAVRVLADTSPSARAMPGYVPLCLTIRGTRLSESGPVVPRPVSGSICNYGTFPVLELATAQAGAIAMVALTQPAPDGRVHVVGHTPAELVRTPGEAPNRVVHFADDRSAAQLDLLTRAVRDAGRDDAATAVVAALTTAQLASARHEPDVVYADGDSGAWRRAFGLDGGPAQRPATLVVSPRGQVVWRHDGPVDAAALTAALRKVLVAGRAVPRTLRTLNLRLGRQAPNFVFEVAPGHALTLRKLEGRAAVLVFWRSTAPASIEAVREQQAAAREHQPAGPSLLVLAVNDGEPPDVARRAAAAHRLSATLVPDPLRTISAAYGVNLWPTTVRLDAQSVARSIAYGRDEGGQGGYSHHGGTQLKAAT